MPDLLPIGWLIVVLNQSSNCGVVSNFDNGVAGVDGVTCVMCAVYSELVVPVPPRTDLVAVSAGLSTSETLQVNITIS